MQVFDNEYVVAFDIDQTLIMHSDSFGDMEIFNPYSGSKIKFYENKLHTELLKQYKGRGMCIMVWSAGGTQWAKTIINTLNLQDYVDLIITKPSKYVDDLKASKILVNRVYLE